MVKEKNECLVYTENWEGIIATFAYVRLYVRLTCSVCEGVLVCLRTAPALGRPLWRMLTGGKKSKKKNEEKMCKDGENEGVNIRRWKPSGRL